jgi:hypothetical protein
MALSHQNDFLAFLCLPKMTYRNFIISRIRQSTAAPLPCKMALCSKFKKLTYRNWQTAERQCKYHREYRRLVKRALYCSFTLSDKVNRFRLSRWNGFMLLLCWCTLKFKKEKRAGLQFTSMDYFSLILTLLGIRWTIPFNVVSRPGPPADRWK